MSDNFFKRGDRRFPTARCNCGIRQKVCVENGKRLEYIFNDIELKENVDILVLTEVLEEQNKKEYLTRLINKLFEGFSVKLYPALGCVPAGRFVDKDTINTYTNCSRLNISQRIAFMKPKVIVTTGRALYTITGDKQLTPQVFFIPHRRAIPINDPKHKEYFREFYKDDCWLFSQEYNCRVYPVPSTYQWLSDKSGEPLDVYETMFVYDQLTRAKMYLELGAIQERTAIPSYNIVENSSDILRRIINDTSTTDIAIDTESEGLNPFQHKLISMQVATDNTNGYFLRWKDIDKELVRGLFSCGKNIIMHNGIYDTKVLRINDIDNAYCSFDTLLAAHQCNENAPKSLKSLAWLHTRLGGYEQEFTEERENLRMKFTDVREDILAKYGCYDAVVTFKLFEYFKNRLELEDKDVRDNFYNYVMPAVPMIADIEIHGVIVDLNYLKEYNTIIHKRKEELEKQIHETIGRKFDINSNKELSGALVEKYKIRKNDDNRTKAGDIKVNQKALEKYASTNKADVSPLITEYKHVVKEISQLGIDEYLASGKKKGFVEALKGNTLYGSYKLHGTVSGRASGGKDKKNKTSSSMIGADFGINFQNIPTTKSFRKLFIAPKGYVWGTCDFAGMEMTIQSQAAGQGPLEEAISSGKDLHCVTGVKLAELSGINISYAEFVKKSKVEKIKEFVDFRKVAKSINFGISYGSRAKGLARNLKVDIETAKKYYDSYFSLYPDIRCLMDRQIKQVKEIGWVKTLLGKKRRIPQLTYIGKDSFRNFDKSTFSISHLTNNSVNHCAQGTSGQTTIIAMTNIWKEFKERNLKSKVIINVHDEICFYIAIEEIETAKEIIERQMTRKYYNNYNGNKLGLEAELEIGEIWKSEKPFSYWKEHQDEFEMMVAQINKRSESNKLDITQFK